MYIALLLSFFAAITAVLSRHTILIMLTTMFSFFLSAYLLLTIRKLVATASELIRCAAPDRPQSGVNQSGAYSTEAVRQRLSALTLRIKSILNFDLNQRRPTPVDACNNALKRVHCDKFNSGEDLQELMRAVLEEVYRNCCCSAVAIIEEHPESNSSLIASLGAGGRRFESCLMHFHSIRQSFSEDSTRTCILYEFSSDELFGKAMHLFQVHYCMTFLISCNTGSSMYLWVGYPESRSPVESDSDWLKAYCTHVTDNISALSERLRLKQQVRESSESSQMKSQFIAHLSHDLRSPLNNIRVILNLFKLENSMPENNDLLEVAHSNCASVEELVEAILDYSRYTTGNLQSTPTLWDLTELIQEVICSYQHMAAMKEIALAYEIVLPTCYCGIAYADRSQIKRVLANLVGNAVEYTDSGSVTVQLRSTADLQLLLAVRDTGAGINPEEINNLFIPFVRGSKKARYDQGAGLGLAVSKILSELNGGSIDVSSSIGAGSVFSITLPAADPVDAKNYIDHKQSNRSQHNQQYIPDLPSEHLAQVLIVDDDSDCTHTLSRTLAHKGYSTHCATSVEQALVFYQHYKHGVIITDLSMPDGGGERLIQEICSDRGASPFFIVLSGRELNQELTALSDSSKSYYIKKPVNVEELSQLLADFQVKPATLARKVA